MPRRINAPTTSIAVFMRTAPEDDILSPMRLRRSKKREKPHHLVAAPANYSQLRPGAPESMIARKRGEGATNLGERVVESEVDFDVGGNRDRLAVLQSGLDAPLLHRFDGLLIQALPQRADHLDFLRHAILVYDELQQHGALPLGFAGFFGVLGLGPENRNGSANASADLVGSAAESAAAARPNTRTSTGTDAGADAVSRGWNAQLAERIAVIAGGNVRQ